MKDWNNKDEVLEAVRNDGYPLKQVSEENLSLDEIRFEWN